MKDHSVAILSDITTFMKYAKFIPEIGRRETWQELCERNMAMHIRKFPQLRAEIQRVYKEFVLTKKVLPSMRSLQFGGRPIELAPSRIYNCAYAPVESPEVFSEAMFLLLGGTGFGFSVQRRHVSQLPCMLGARSETRRFVVGDSIEGWADAVKVLIEAYFYGKRYPIFDFSDIRPKGAALITSGGKAPGPDPLARCLEKLTKVMDRAIAERGYTKLTTLECHDMLCHIADAVLAGGIRRAAMISLFDRDDHEMLTCKSGNWWEENAQRGRANNSATLPRGEVSEGEFKAIWQLVEDSGAGEPGVYWTNNTDWGTNPCCEIGLRPYQFCNLTEINADDCYTQDELNARARAGAFIGTLQAGYTDFHYLRPIWRETTERDALIGVGLTGIGSGAILNLNLTDAAEHAVCENVRVAEIIGINSAARTSTIKPAGTSSLVLGSASGVHAWHNDFYVRRIRVGKNESIYRYLAEHHPELVEDEFFRPDEQAVISVPQKAPAGAILRHESPEELLERVRKFNLEWVRAGHVDGDNTHNVSCTISVKDDEWEKVGQWMWDNRDLYNGISVLPYNGGTYQQAPFQDITEDEYNRLIGTLSDVDLTRIVELEDNTDLSGEIACGAGGCEVK